MNKHEGDERVALEGVCSLDCGGMYDAALSAPESSSPKVKVNATPPLVRNSDGEEDISDSHVK